MRTPLLISRPVTAYVFARRHPVRHDYSLTRKQQIDLGLSPVLTTPPSVFPPCVGLYAGHSIIYIEVSDMAKVLEDYKAMMDKYGKVNHTNQESKA